MATASETLDDPISEDKPIEEKTASAANNNEPALSETISQSPSTNQTITATNSNSQQSLTQKTRANTKGKREILLKIVIIGDMATGKTALVKQYVRNGFSEHYRATVGVDFALKIVKSDDNKVIRLQLWDVSGQERYGHLTDTYYKNAVGCFIVSDASRDSTVEGAAKWKTDLDSKVQLPDGNPVPCVLLANKCDLGKEGLVNNVEQMDEFCREKGFIKWFETSAKGKNNLEEAFKYLIDEIMKTWDESQLRSSSHTPIEDPIEVKKKKKKVSKKRNKSICFCGRAVDSD